MHLLKSWDPDYRTLTFEVRQQVAYELAGSMSLKNPGGCPDYDEITEAINNMDNADFLRIVSDAVEDRLAGALADLN
jgi:hypothetical protein